MEVQDLAVCCWRYLAKEGFDALPLKQRIPEVALFRGEELQACYGSGPRGLLQRHGDKEATREHLLDRLLMPYSRKGAEQLTRNTPVALLRWATAGAGAGEAADAAAACRCRVVRAGEVMELLEQRPGAGVPATAMPPDVAAGEAWSLQGLVTPSNGLRHVAVYSRTPSGEEGMEVFSKRFHEAFASPEEYEQPEQVAAPPEQAQVVEGKAIAIVRYLHRFQGLALARMVAEFVVDASGRTVLTGFEQAALLPADAAQELLRESPSLQESMTSSAAVSTELGTSRPNSATTAAADTAASSRQTSARDPMGGSRPGSRPVSASGLGQRPGSRPASASGGGVGTSADPQGVHIDEDIAEESDDVDEVIERARAAAKPKARPRRRPSKRTGRASEPLRAPSPEAPTRRRPLSARARLGGRSEDSSASPPEAPPAQAPRPRRPRQRPSSAKASVGPTSSVSAPAAPRPQPPPPRPVAAPQPPPPPPRPEPAAPARGPVRARRPASARAAPAVAAARQQQQQDQQELQASAAAAAATASSRGVLLRARSASTGNLRRAHSASTPTQQFHSRQLFSRYEKESEARPRMISVLARQLERLRERAPLWAAQKEALAAVVAKQAQCLAGATSDVEKGHVERESIEKLLSQKYDVLVRGLHREQEKAQAAAEEKHRELERSLELERETTQILGEEEAKNRVLKCTLDRTMVQLDSVKADMQQLHASAEAKGLEIVAGAVPRLQAQQRQIDAGRQEKEHLRAEAMATMQELAGVAEELHQQRAFTARLEEFVRRLTGHGATRYVLDPALKKEATRLLAAASRRVPLNDEELLQGTSAGGFAMEELASSASGASPRAPMFTGGAVPLSPRISPPLALPVGAGGAVGPPGFQAARRGAEDAVLGGVRQERWVAAAS